MARFYFWFFWGILLTSMTKITKNDKNCTKMQNLFVVECWTNVKVCVCGILHLVSFGTLSARFISDAFLHGISVACYLNFYYGQQNVETYFLVHQFNTSSPRIWEGAERCGRRAMRGDLSVSYILRFTTVPLLPHFLDPSIGIHYSATFTLFFVP